MTDEELKKAQIWRKVAIGIYYICICIYTITSLSILYQMFNFQRVYFKTVSLGHGLMFHAFCLLGCFLLTLAMTKIHREEKKNEEDFECYMDRVIDYHMGTRTMTHTKL